jgi:hypothetical protein
MLEVKITKNVLQEKFIEPVLESKRNYLTNAVEYQPKIKRKGLDRNPARQLILL